MPTYRNTQTGEMSDDLYNMQGLKFPKKGGTVKNVIEENIPDKYANHPGVLKFKQEQANFISNPMEAMQPYRPGIEENLGHTGFGESRYDEEITAPNQIQNLSNTRAQLQPWYQQAGLAIGKGGILAGTTFLDGTIGTIAGLGNMVVEGKGSAYWDNPFSQTMADVNKWSEEALPNYYSDVEKQNDANGEWYKNIFTPNFVFDKVAKNMGFAIGAIYSGKVGASALGFAGNKLGLGVARNLATGAVAGEANVIQTGKIASGELAMSGAEVAATAAKNASEVSKLGLFKYWGGSVLGAQGEARIEAINNTRDFQDLKTNQLRDVVAQKREAIIQQLSQDSRNLISVPKYNDSGAFVGMETTLTPEAQKQVADFTNKEMTRGMSIIKDATETMGNHIFFGNMALLTFTNAFQFGNYFKGGFKASAKNINKYIKPVLNEAGETIGTTVEKKAFKNIAKGAAGNFIAEGPVEEMGQGVISKGAGYQQAARINTLYGATIDPEATKDTENGFNALAKAAAETYGTSAGWEEGFIGGITGLIGIPGISINNGKVKLKLEGGIKEAVTEHNETVRAAEEVSQQLNQIYGSEKFQEYTQGLVRGKSFDAQMAKAAADKDAFNYKNAEHASLINAAITFEKADRIDDLYNMINSAANATEEDIKQARTITKEDGTSLYEGMTDAEIKQQFKDRAAKQKQAVDKYRKIASDLSSTISDKFHGEELEEMVFMASNVDNLESRFKDLHDEIKQPLNTIAAHLEQKYGDEVKSKVDNIREITSMNPTEMSLTLSKAENKASVEKLKNLYTDLQKSYDLNKDDLGSKINDLSKLMETRLATLDKFNLFMTNPSKLTEEIQEAKAKVDVINKDKKVSEQKDVLSNIQDYQSFKTAVESVQDADTKLATQEALAQLTKENNPLAATYSKHNTVRDALIDSIRQNNPNQTEERDLAEHLVNTAYNNSTENDSLSDINHPEYNTPVVNYNGKIYEDVQEPEIGSFAGVENPKDTKLLDAKSMLHASINTFNKVKTTKDNYAPNPTVTSTESPKETTAPGAATTEEVFDDLDKTNKDIIEEVKVIEETTTKNSKGVEKRMYWKPEISEFTIQSKNDLDFRSNYGKDFPSFEGIYNYLVTRGAFTYVNEGNVSSGDEIFFVVDKIALDVVGDKGFPILMAVKNKEGGYQVLGTLEEAHHNVDTFVGMVSLRNRIIEAYKQSDNKEFYVHNETTHVFQLEPGRVKSSQQDYNLNEVDSTDGTKNNPEDLIFAYVKNGQLEIPEYEGLNVRQPKKLVDGRAYLVIKSGNSQAQLTMIKTKSFNKNFKASEMPVISKRLTEIATKIANNFVNQTQQLLEGIPFESTTNNIGAIKNELNNVLYFVDKNLHFDLLNNNIRIKFTDNKGNAQIIEVALTDNIDQVTTDILTALQSFNLHFNLKFKGLNTPAGNTDLVNDNIVTVNTNTTTRVAVHPYINPIDDNGVELKGEAPAHGKDFNPHRTIKNTIVSHKGKVYQVDLTEDKIFHSTYKVEKEVTDMDSVDRAVLTALAQLEVNKDNKQWQADNIVDGNYIYDSENGLVFNIKDGKFIDKKAIKNIPEVVVEDNSMEVEYAKKAEAINKRRLEVKTIFKTNKLLAIHIIQKEKKIGSFDNYGKPNGDIQSVVAVLGVDVDTAQKLIQEYLKSGKKIGWKFGDNYDFSKYDKELTELKQANTVKPIENKPTINPFSSLGNSTIQINQKPLSKINTFDSEKLSKVTNFAELPGDIQSKLEAKGIEAFEYNMFTQTEREKALDCLGF